ncbi:MAG TPA: endo-1,4-beta-xylanase [Steroidobacteraceae bacterium]|nr:endo-1,4-beta-xylanase [Steroidobacteraceae bacterium]
MAQTEPVIIEAESTTVGSVYTTGTLDGANYVTIINDSPGFGPPATADGALIYTVTFPAPGNYELYARFRVGPGGGSDDSFFIGNGFGNKVGTSEWTLVNQVDGGGFTNPTDTVRNNGPAGTQVFKWFKVTGFAGPSVWVVPPGQLTQTFSVAGRETGNFLDKFAFGVQGSWYTVNNLDTGSAATGTPPPPPPPPYTPPGPPMATGKDKFVGSAHSPGQGSLNFDKYFNQVTPENGGKWGAVEGTRDVMNWNDAHAAYDFAKANGFKFKWHTLVWGNQQPGWIETLPPEEQLQEIEEWMDAIAKEFPDIDQIDVVNEPLHDPPCSPGGGGGNYCQALGGPGVTGWDWVIKAFELARHYFPNSQLLINDYSITNDTNATTRYLEIIKLLQDRGLIDGIGDQAHAFSTTEAAPMKTHRANLDRLAATGLPIYITEFDLDGNDDPVQLANYQRVFPVFWEHPAVKGITLWGYHQNTHWRRAQGDWLIYANGAERPAMVWLQAYVRNTPPTVVPNQSFSVDENAGGGAAVGTVVATDVDTDQTLSGWQIDGGSGVSLFQIDAATGALTVIDSNSLDFESATSYTLNVSVYDGYRRSESQTVTVNVRNLNDNTPVITGPASFPIDGGSRNVIGTMNATDADDANQAGFTTFNWQVVGGNGANVIAIGASDGRLRVPRPTGIDFRKSSYSLVVQVNDGAHTSAQQSVTITIPNRIHTCLYGVGVVSSKKLTPLLLLIGAELGTCR